MRRHIRLMLAWLAAFSTVTVYAGQLSESAAERLPIQLTDQEFWRLSSELSEPDGTYPSDNLLSNELAFTQVVHVLAEETRRGGVYLGVGPEQNFTYIAALKPRIAFIIDVRRDNLLL